MPSRERLLNTRTVERSVLMALVKISLQRYVRKGNGKNPAILSFCLLRTQLNATHAQLLEKLRQIPSAETCLFLPVQSLEFQEIWQKK